jgi:hypothetical protein
MKFRSLICGQQFPLIACESYMTYVGGCLQGQCDASVVGFEAPRAIGGVPPLAPSRFWSLSRRSSALAMEHERFRSQRTHRLIRDVD